MSLGWQTESALVPRTSKKIDVESGSILPLKAFIFEQQQKQGKNQKMGTKYRKNLRGVGNKDADKPVHNSASDQEISEGSRVYASLEAKSRLYEKLAYSKSIGSDHFDEAEDGSYLVDFNEKGCGKEAHELVSAILPVSKSVAPSNDSADSSANKMASSSSTIHQYTGNFVAASNEDRSARQVSSFSAGIGGGVKSQWEKTLGSGAKHFIDDIHAESTAHRAKGGIEIVSSQASSSSSGPPQQGVSNAELRLALLRKKQRRE